MNVLRNIFHERRAKLVACFKQFELWAFSVCPHPTYPDGLALALEMFHGELSLTYNHKPLHAWSFKELVEASKEISQFKISLQQSRERGLDDMNEAFKNLERFNAASDSTVPKLSSVG